MSPRTRGRDPRRAPPAFPILILAALPLEVRPFLRRVKARPRQDLGLPAWELEPGPGLVALSGMGAAAAGRAGEALVRRCRPGLLISLGFGGALAPGLAAGSLVLGESFWRYDPDRGELTGGEEPAFPLPLARLKGALQAAGLTAITAPVVSTHCIIHKGSQGGPLAGLPSPVLDLETAALAEVAAAQEVAFLSLRAITDEAAEEIPACLREIGGRQTAVDGWAVIRWLAAGCRRVKNLLHLWRRSRTAAQVLAQALTILWPLLLAAGNELQGQPGQKGDIDEDSHPAQAGLPDEEGHR